MANLPHTRTSSRAMGSSRLHLRNDALIIGPGGEVIAAHAAGTLLPAIPEPIIGRIPNVDPGDIMHPSLVPGVGNKAAPPVTIAFISTTVISNPATATLVVSVTGSSAPSTQNSPLSIAAAQPTLTRSDSLLPTSSATSASLATSTTPISSTSLSSQTSDTTSTAILTSTASPTANNTPTDSMSPAEQHELNTKIAIVLGSLAGGALFIVLILWFVRMRARSRRQKLHDRTQWPWDDDNRPIEDAFDASSHHGNESKAPSLYSVLPLPAGLVERDAIMHDSHYVPMPQSPYRMVSSVGVHQSVPDLAPDMGTLRVANYVPGDSRAASRLESADGQRSRSSEGPNTSLDDFGLLRTPWPPLRKLSSWSALGLGISETDHDSGHPPSSMNCSKEDQVTNTPSPASWVSSIRTNIASAFHAVVGGSPDESSVRDNYTAEPVRISRVSSHQSGPSLSRQESLHSQAASSHQGAGQVINPDNLSAWLSEPNFAQDFCESELAIPPLAIIKNRDRQGTTLSRASSVYSTASVLRVPQGNAYERSPGFLPRIEMSRSGSQSSLQKAFQEESLDTETPTEPSDTSHRDRARSIPHSMMSSLSRNSSAASEALTDQEQYARSILKDRSKRTSDTIVLEPEQLESPTPHPDDS
ncbi:hypothetical protein BDW22DRAFT_1421205 [Trametopsis cervina]|nr:hypothetical protein BDW22DRAFT_1421205 [Trametopsis cervina]